MNITRHLATNFAAIIAKQEASEGICAEPYMGNVVAEDRQLPTSGLWCDPIPMPLDPLAQLGDDAE